MPDRGADEGKANRHIDRLIPRQKFERDQALIVISGDDGVIGCVFRVEVAEKSVGGKWSFKFRGADAVNGADDRAKEFLFLAIADFTSMWVEAAAGDVRSSTCAVSRKKRMRSSKRPRNRAFLGQSRSDIGQRNMPRQ